MFAALHIQYASNVHSVSHSSRALALLGIVWRRPTRPDPTRARLRTTDWATRSLRPPPPRTSDEEEDEDEVSFVRSPRSR